jgi:hypothetical protein
MLKREDPPLLVIARFTASFTLPPHRSRPDIAGLRADQRSLGIEKQATSLAGAPKSFLDH